MKKSMYLIIAALDLMSINLIAMKRVIIEEEIDQDRFGSSMCENIGLRLGFTKR